MNNIKSESKDNPPIMFCSHCGTQMAVKRKPFIVIPIFDNKTGEPEHLMHCILQCPNRKWGMLSKHSKFVMHWDKSTKEWVHPYCYG